MQRFGWFVGHVTLLFTALRYGFSYITFHPYTRWARFSYRTAFLAAAVTYGVVVLKAYRARARSPPIPRQPSGPLAVATDENVQYLGMSVMLSTLLPIGGSTGRWLIGLSLGSVMAIVWLFSPQIPLALLPFVVYSIFHVATYTRSNLIPTIQPPQPASGPNKSPAPVRPMTRSSPVADSLGRFVRGYYDPSMTLVASLEISLWFRVLFSAIIFTKGSWILLAIYTAFMRARYSQSNFVRTAVKRGGSRVDALVAGQGTPPAARQAWETVKRLAAQVTDATDVGKYIKPQSNGIKKAH